MKNHCVRISPILMLLIIVLMCACQKAPVEGNNVLSFTPTTTQDRLDMSCMPPVVNLAFRTDEQNIVDARPTDIAPLSGWQVQAQLPTSLGNNTARIILNNNEIWILLIESKMIYRYNIDTKVWSNYSKIDDSFVIPRNLFLTRDGTLFGFAVLPYGVDYKKEFPFISRFDETTNQFRFVSDEENILQQVYITSDPMEIIEDKNGLLWMILSDKDNSGLYSFNPKSLKAEKHLMLDPGLIYTGPVMVPDGKIWFYSGGNDRRLIKYSPETRQPEIYIGPPNFERIGHITTLFLDRSGRLWLENKGWLDFSDPSHPIWYEIIPSAAFFTDRGNFQVMDNAEGARTRYGWLIPTRIFQSTNGWYWFTTLYGMIRLKPDEGEWCLFTTGTSPVVEDNNDNVWIVVFDKLYKFSVKP
jgi:hypothetical protein